MCGGLVGNVKDLSQVLDRQVALPLGNCQELDPLLPRELAPRPRNRRSRGGGAGTRRRCVGCRVPQHEAGQRLEDGLASLTGPKLVALGDVDHLVLEIGDRSQRRGHILDRLDLEAEAPARSMRFRDETGPDPW